MAKKDRWFLPTNTDNFKMMVVQGLITSSDGFRKKYYKDELANYMGFIPLFKNTIPEKTLELIVSEADNMTKCLIEIDLSKITGCIKDKNDDEVNLKEVQDDLILLPAPLPLSTIKQVIFDSEKNKNSLFDEQKITSNFILAGLKLQSAKADHKLFKAENDLLDDNSLHDTVKTNNNNQDSLKIDCQKAYAFGGLLSNLLYFTKNGKLSNQVYKFFYTDDKTKLEKDKLCIHQYFYQTGGNDDLYLMYQHLIKKIIKGGDFKNNIIELLESGVWDKNKKLKKRTEELAQKLRNFENNDKLVSESFKATKTPLEELLLMLFHLENTQRLTECDSLAEVQRDLFTEEDYLLFALVFGIRDKFIKTPKFIREYQNLQNFISFKMAEYAHKDVNNGIQFTRPKEPKTIFDILNTQKNRKKIIDKLEIKDCVETSMIGDYQRRGNKSTYQGFVEPKYEFIETNLFKKMSIKNIDAELYNQLITLK